ncbi:restriction endonuclease [Microvirga sp. KLBC 81]|uniref:restriction endonuclease n=1 Tax=Microvirga sp. KLBC 81 TaxID=1862707 RepID=UPI001403BA65|nr:restriction endonuclease [Microvirga sp. KLBC 81]
MMFLDAVFDMGSGYVLNFSDRTFAQLSAEELNIDINDPVYAREGGSKAKRLCSFLRTVDTPTVTRTLNALWEYREALRQRTGQADKVHDAHGRLSLINRPEGRPDCSQAPTLRPTPAFNCEKLDQLKSDLLAMTSLEAYARGYAFEKFLRDLFDTYSAAGALPAEWRADRRQLPVRQRDLQTYLVEAKWHGKPMGVAELHTFHGKIEQKAAWTRGPFVSNSGFTDEGLAALGRGKCVICMDGYDLYETLNREIPLNHVLERSGGALKLIPL